MDSTKFKRCGNDLIEWAARYMETLNERMPLPDVEPGFLRSIVPEDPPEKPESFDRILKDLEPVVLDGMAHWQHRQFFAYFPAGNSWASVLGDIFSNATGVNGTTWESCPVVTELECRVCDWCCKFLGLPKFFLSQYTCPESEGTGILQQSASEAIFYSMVWAREDAVKRLREKNPSKPRAVLLNMLVAYCNYECHSCVERAALMGCIKLRKLQSDMEGGLTANVLRTAIEEDLAAGLVPFFHCGIIGSTGITSVDDMMEVGPVCEEYGLWLHVDCAYAGSCFGCQEMNYLKNGFQYLWSANINCNKWMMCNFEASLHWVRYSTKAVDPMTGWDDDVWKTSHPPDLKHYGIASSRRFRAFKLWCVIRNYGVEGLRRYCRNHTNLAKLFEAYVKRDNRFEVVGPTRFGLVSFRLKGLNDVTSRLLDVLNFSRKIHMVPSNFHNKVVIRFALCAEWANEEDIDEAWQMVDSYASVVIREYQKINGDSSPMQALYEKQKQRDELQSKNPDEVIAEREKEAETVGAEFLKKLKESSAPALHKSIDDSAYNGTITKGMRKSVAEYDDYLHENPGETEDKVYVNPDVPTDSPSMLHYPLMEETRRNSMAAQGEGEEGEGGAPGRGASKASVKAPGGDASRASVMPPGGEASRASVMPPGGEASRASVMPPGGEASRASVMPPGGEASRASVMPPGGAASKTSVKSGGVASIAPSVKSVKSAKESGEDEGSEDIISGSDVDAEGEEEEEEK